MPKVHRGGSTGLLRPHSRSASASKLGANLQFTQKEQPPPRTVDKSKKNTVAHDNTQTHGKGVSRVASAQRIQSREHVQPFVPKQRAAPPQHHKISGGKGKAGFTIASPSEEDDEDAWVSSESGAVTPSNDHSSSESESDDNIPDDEVIRQLTGKRHPQPEHPTTTTTRAETATLPRVETARQSDFSSQMMNTPRQKSELQQQRHETRSETRTPTLPPIQTSPPPQQHVEAQQSRRSFDTETIHEDTVPEVPSPSQPSPRPSSRRKASTRPPSSHSIRGDHALRPHPLIRGHSHGQIYPAKPAPLEPLTVIQDASSVAPPPDNVLDGTRLSTSPSSSIKTNATSPGGSNRDSPSQQRRTSISSARSVATLPAHSSLRDSVNWTLSDRKRTMSSVSHSSSSAALSSLVHLPTVTRPPSPQPISFFPPPNPHVNIEGIHPLLPGPYLNNHLTVLSRRTPIKESFDRVDALPCRGHQDVTLTVLHDINRRFPRTLFSRSVFI
ncbi:hypothetical protein LshimejAT787_0403320 [Lyophyllum shimeji]|uniref:Uncharacterized protein n=1 Tax=Lyophyllum shimeji TaxID=47721 RepID=A0A9P3PKA8_LYOSH|nr:hypothetical protein LshimejAT787_0403320 [Lyophyllum shimeji]